MTLQGHPETNWAFETLVWDRTKHDFVAVVSQSPQLTTAGQFLKGPVPMWWLARAASLPGKSLAVGLCVWRLVGVMKKDTVRLATKEVEAMGVDRHAKSRAIRHLEQAGLVAVERKQGRFPIVTVVRDPAPTGRPSAPAPKSDRLSGAPDALPSAVLAGGHIGSSLISSRRREPKGAASGSASLADN
jgi:hypothetical protein